MTEFECRALAGSTINGRVVTFGDRGCGGFWTPSGTCFEDAGKLYYTLPDCRSQPRYDIYTMMCKPGGGAEMALETNALEFQVIDSTHNAVTLFAVIGAMSLVYHGVKKIHKVVFAPSEFQKINDDEC